jgi:hypothetical protein
MAEEELKASLNGPCWIGNSVVCLVMIGTDNSQNPVTDGVSRLLSRELPPATI